MQAICFPDHLIAKIVNLLDPKILSLLSKNFKQRHHEIKALNLIKDKVFNMSSLDEHERIYASKRVNHLIKKFENSSDYSANILSGLFFRLFLHGLSDKVENPIDKLYLDSFKMSLQDILRTLLIAKPQLFKDILHAFFTRDSLLPVEEKAIYCNFIEGIRLLDKSLTENKPNLFKIFCSIYYSLTTWSAKRSLIQLLISIPIENKQFILILSHLTSKLITDCPKIFKSNGVLDQHFISFLNSLPTQFQKNILNTSGHSFALIKTHYLLGLNQLLPNEANEPTYETLKNYFYSFAGCSNIEDLGTLITDFRAFLKKNQNASLDQIGRYSNCEAHFLKFYSYELKFETLVENTFQKDFTIQLSKDVPKKYYENFKEECFKIFKVHFSDSSKSFIDSTLDFKEELNFMNLSYLFSYILNTFLLTHTTNNFFPFEQFEQLLETFPKEFLDKFMESSNNSFPILRAKNLLGFWNLSMKTLKNPVIFDHFKTCLDSFCQKEMQTYHSFMKRILTLNEMILHQMQNQYHFNDIPLHLLPPCLYDHQEKSQHISILMTSWGLTHKEIHQIAFQEYFKNFRFKYFDLFYQKLSDEDKVSFSLNGMKNSSADDKDRFWKLIDKSLDSDIAGIDLDDFIENMKEATHDHNSAIIRYYLRSINRSGTYPEAVAAIIETLNKSSITKDDKKMILQNIARRPDLIEALLFNPYSNCKKYQLFLHGLNIVFDFELLPLLSHKIIERLHENYIGLLIFFILKAKVIRSMDHAQIVDNQIWLPQFLKYLMHENPHETLELYFRYHVKILHAMDTKNLKKNLQEAKGFYIKLYKLCSDFFSQNKAAIAKLQQINRELSLWLASLPD